MSTIRENELKLELLSSAGMNPWAQHDSSSRAQMFAGHLSQALVIDGASPRRCQTGIEREFGKCTFSIKMPCDAEIIKVIDKFPRTLGQGSIRENPMSVIVYEDSETKKVGIVTVRHFHCKHQHFGFRYKFRPSVMNRLVPGATIAAGTILADSPAVDEKGNYSIATEAEVVFLSIPGVIEDGVVISKSYAKKLTTRGYETRVASWGSKQYPLNLYGNENEYKPFPDIGERVAEDGLLFAIRDYDPLLAPLEMTPAALRQVDHTFDDRTYVEFPNARVVDVNVLHDVRNNVPPTPVGMDAQTRKYYAAQYKFYESLLAVYDDLRRRRKDSLQITPEFQRLLREARFYTQEPGKLRATPMVQRQPLDDWRVEITFEYEIAADVGFKLTDMHGGKGIVCAVWDDEDMPIDRHGNRADCIMDGDSTIKRMNVGRLYEQYINATSRHVSREVRQWMDNPTQENIDAAWQRVTDYYRIVSPRMFDLITGPSYKAQPRFHLEALAKDGIYLYLPTDNPAYSPDIIEQLRTQFPIGIGPVSYRGRSGNMVETEIPALIGSLYVMLLEKTGGDWSAVSSAKLQHFGIPARMTRHDKYALPGRANPVRILGESEVRLLAATVGGDMTAELLENSNCPQAHKQIVATILRSENPSSIPDVIDRNIVPRGGSRSLIYVNHALQCAGVEFYRQTSTEMGPVTYPPDPNVILERTKKRAERQKKSKLADADETIDLDLETEEEPEVLDFSDD